LRFHPLQRRKPETKNARDSITDVSWIQKWVLPSSVKLENDPKPQRPITKKKIDSAFPALFINNNTTIKTNNNPQHTSCGVATTRKS
jgi:hypothetical protein